MREMLLDAIEAVRSGKLDSQQAAAIAKLAAQVNLSMQVELHARQDALVLARAKQIGSLQLGDESTIEAAA
jgi:hypothetical protein